MSDFRARAEAQRARLDEMRQKMSQHQTGGGNNFWKPPIGKSLIRILPPVGDMEYPWQLTGRHNLGDDAKNLLCPAFTTDYQLPCPICELWEEAHKMNDKKMQERLKVRRTFPMNVVVRGIKEGEEDRGPLIWTPGIKVFQDMNELLNDPECGDFSDPIMGYDLKISRKGEGIDTEYHIHASAVKKPIFGTDKRSDDDAIQTLLDAAMDLSKVINDLLTYEELYAKISTEDSATSGKNSRDSEFPDDEDL